MHSTSGQFCQRDFSINHDLFRGRGHAAQPETHALVALVHDSAASQVQVFGVTEDCLVEHAAIFHGATHDLGADDRRPVIGKGHGPTRYQAAHLS